MRTRHAGATGKSTATYATRKYSVAHAGTAHGTGSKSK